MPKKYKVYTRPRKPKPGIGGLKRGPRKMVKYDKVQGGLVPKYKKVK